MTVDETTAAEEIGEAQRGPTAAQLRLQRAVLFTKEGDHIALLTLEPPNQRRQQHLQRNHTSTLTLGGAVSVLGQYGVENGRHDVISTCSMNTTRRSFLVGIAS